jgi:hypothetical protein
MVVPALGALDVVLAAALETAMVLRPLRREDMLTAVAAGPTLPLTAAAAPPVPVTSAVVAVGAAPRPLRPRRCSSGGNCLYSPFRMPARCFQIGISLPCIGWHGD